MNPVQYAFWQRWVSAENAVFKHIYAKPESFKNREECQMWYEEFHAKQVSREIAEDNCRAEKVPNF